MSLEDFEGTYKITQIVSEMKDFEGEDHLIKIAGTTTPTVTCQSGCSNSYEGIRREPSELKGTLTKDGQHRPFTIVKVASKEGKKRLKCTIYSDKNPNELGSWTAEDQGGGMGGEG